MTPTERTEKTATSGRTANSAYPMHTHDSEQMTYILQGALRFLVAGEEMIVREGEVLHIPSRLPHQAEALEDTLELDVFSPVRAEWMDAADEGNL